MLLSSLPNIFNEIRIMVILTIIHLNVTEWSQLSLLNKKILISFWIYRFYFIDITNRRSAYKKIVEKSPDVIILTAAMTDVDQNEIEKYFALKLNTEGPINVLADCKKLDSILIFMLTEFVFDCKNRKIIETILNLE